MNTVESQVAEESLSLLGQIPIAELVAQSDLIVRGRIVETFSEWNADQTAITTVSTVEASYVLSGAATEQLSIHTDGGFVDGDIGMKSSNDPLLSEGEEVLLFLYEDGNKLKITQGELGRYLVSGKYLANGVLRTTEKMEDVYTEIHAALLAQDRVVETPEEWESLENDAPPIVFDGYDGQGFVYKNRKWGGTCPEVKYKVNINSAQAGGENGSVEDFRNAIISAANSWNAVGTSDYVLTYDGVTDATTTGFNGSNEIIFSAEGTSSPTGLARFWFTADFIIVEADIWFNDDFNWDATGSPKFTEVDLESVALHEFGHWLALGHDDSASAIMYPTLTMGTLKRELGQNEIDGISFIYPRPSDSACAQAELPTATATKTPIPPTATPIPPTVTPTPVKPGLSSNYEDGSPGSFFTIYGENYSPSEVVNLSINGAGGLQLEANDEGVFALILDTHDATPGTYTLQVLSVASAGSTRSNTNRVTQTISIELDHAKELRPRAKPERTGEVEVIEIELTNISGAANLYLPLVQH